MEFRPLKIILDGLNLKSPFNCYPTHHTFMFYIGKLIIRYQRRCQLSEREDAAKASDAALYRHNKYNAKSILG